MARTRRDIEALAIEKGLPVPKMRHRRTAAGFTADKMQPGDSVRFETRADALSLCNALRYRNMKYTMRRTDSGTGYRVWRL